MTISSLFNPQLRLTLRSSPQNRLFTPVASQASSPFQRIFVVYNASSLQRRIEIVVQSLPQRGIYFQFISHSKSRRTTVCTGGTSYPYIAFNFSAFTSIHSPAGNRRSVYRIEIQVKQFPSGVIFIYIAFCHLNSGTKSRSLFKLCPAGHWSKVVKDSCVCHFLLLSNGGHRSYHFPAGHLLSASFIPICGAKSRSLFTPFPSRTSHRFIPPFIIYVAFVFSTPKS
jgi:hypothetical protein